MKTTHYLLEYSLTTIDKSSPTCAKISHMTWADLPPLGTLVAFESTVRQHSVSKAATELHLTHGAVSRQIQHLERALGTTLFERRNRAMTPTPAATALAAVVTDALTLLSSAARTARQAARPDPLVLSCEPTLLMRWLIPRLPALAQAAGPDLHLSAAGGPVPFDREGIDVAIRRNDFGLPAGVRALWLFDELTGPVCTPGLAQRITTPAGLAAVPRLHTRTRPGAWNEWASGQNITLPPASEQTFEHFYLSLQAAAAGLGIAIGSHALVHDDLATGRLAAPLGFQPDGCAYFLLTRTPDDPRIATLLTWLRDQAQELNQGQNRPATRPPRTWNYS
ncbi:MAG TPA: LysR family transcriptional regulator [Streptosporangiaceae bacterium]|nr:LysR family transcriptional regulator [Streptosporangiaceae bacterium]